jgi:hypothetical protein
MTEFEKLLAEYRKLVEQVNDEQGFLAFLKGQLQEVEGQLKSLASGQRQMQLAVLDFGTAPFPPSSKTDDPTPLDEVGALKAAARAVEILGDGVTAEQLSRHLKISRDAARLRLQRAARVGMIARMGTGRYRAIRRSPEAKTSLNGTAHQPEKIDGSGGAPT